MARSFYSRVSLQPGCGAPLPRRPARRLVLIRAATKRMEREMLLIQGWLKLATGEDMDHLRGRDASPLPDTEPVQVVS